MSPPTDAETGRARQEPEAQTRTRIAADHALITPDGHVVAPLVGWSDTQGVVLVSPSMGHAPREPRFTLTLVHAERRSTAFPPLPGVQRFVYVLEGAVRVNGETLGPDAYAWLPPPENAASPHTLKPTEAGRLLVVEQPYDPLPDTPAPAAVLGHADDRPAEPFLGDPHARLAHLLPDETDPAFDLAVNRFTFDPGAKLPFVETHHNEHGLYLQHGAGVYRLGSGDDTLWAPVTAGDAIWMAAYCPQWFNNTGDAPATYLYTKNVNRPPR
ncbi:MAG: (S)-ureidoglycine aminohydrolase [Planctomycetota bacterium]